MKEKNSYRQMHGCMVLAAAIACMVFGLYRGEMAEVLTKAVNICFECIGLG